RSLKDAHDIARERRAINGGAARMLQGGRFQVRLELARHLVKTRLEAHSKGLVQVAEFRAEVANDTTALALPAAADHFGNRVRATEHRLQPPCRRRGRQLPFELLQLLPALLHVAVEHRKAEVLFAGKVVEESAARYPGGPQDLSELRRMVALAGEQP